MAQICRCEFADDFYWEEIKACYPFCPTGYEEDLELRRCSRAGPEVLSTNFDSFGAETYLTPFNIALTPYTGKSYNDEPFNNPIPVLGRGMYFGNSD